MFKFPAEDHDDIVNNVVGAAIAIGCGAIGAFILWLKFEVAWMIVYGR